jgi:hypothetical protein
MLRSRTFSILSAVALCAATVGCQGNSPTTQKESQPSKAANKAHDHDHGDHDHPSEGPHHGVLVELGNEEYHAELVHDDASGLVTVYLLDSHAEKAVTTAAAEVVINLKHGDKPEQFKLSAQPEDGNPAGQSSRFSLSSKDLIEHLHDVGAAARLNVMIAEMPYSGVIPAEGHDHAGHDHEHAK